MGLKGRDFPTIREDVAGALIPVDRAFAFLLNVRRMIETTDVLAGVCARV